MKESIEPTSERGVPWGSVVAIGLGIIAAVWAFHEWRTERAFQAGGISVPAGVVDKRQATDAEGSITYFISYQFVDSDQREHRAEQNVAVSTYESVDPGSTIEITYVETDPSTSRIGQPHREGWWVVPVLLAAIGAALVAAGVIFRGRQRGAPGADRV